MNYDGTIRVKTELDVKSFKYQISDLENTLNKENQILDKIKSSKPYSEQAKDIKNYQIEIEKTTNKLANLKNLELKQSLKNVSNIQYDQNPLFLKKFSFNSDSIGTKAVGISSNDWNVNNFQYLAEDLRDLKNDAFPNVEESGKKAAKNINSSFSNGIKTLKNFGLALFSIRTAFGLVSKASNAYLSQHTDTAEKLQSIWIALGNLIGPIIEIIANGMLKIIGYLDVFLKALSNGKIDITKGMNSNKKSIDSTAQSMENLNKQMQTYSFDEMNIEQDESSSNTKSGIDLSNDYQFKMPELNPEIVKTLQDMAGWLKENWDWIWKVGAALGVVFGISKISGLLSNIAQLLGGTSAASGLLGLSSTLKTLAAFTALAIEIYIIYHYAKELNEVKNEYEDLSKWNAKNVDEAKKVNDANLKTAESYEKGSKELDHYVTSLERQIDASKSSIDMHTKESESIKGVDKVWDIFGQRKSKLKEMNNQEIQDIINVTKNLQELASQGKLNDDQLKVYNETMQYLSETSKELQGDLANETFLYGNQAESVEYSSTSLYSQIQALKDTQRELGNTDGSISGFIDRITETTDNLFNFKKSAEETSKEVSDSTLDMANNSSSNLDTIDKKLTNVKDSIVTNIINKFADGKSSISNFITEFNKTKDLKSTPTISIQTSTNTIIDQLGKLSGLPLVGDLASKAVQALKSIRLSTGAIINNPGRGVPLGYNVVGGEIGREGILPLTDENAMQQLGYEIGRWITLNATINNFMNTRLVQKETKEISNQNGYLTNGRVM